MGSGRISVRPLIRQRVRTRRDPVYSQHPEWGPILQQQLAGKNVCITGWLLYDYEHPPQLGHTRGTLWELHPITGIALLGPDGSCVPWTP